MKTIKLQASNIAKLTGHNKFENKEKTIHSILNFNKIKKIYVPKSNIEETLLKLDEETLKKIKKEMNLDEKSNINTIEDHIKKVIMAKSYSKNINEDQSRAIITNNLNGKDNLKLIEKSIQKDLMMKRGNIKENSNLNYIQKKRNMKIKDRNSKMYEKLLYKDPDNIYEIIIRGKMDGISNDYIIETKNRTKRLFNHIPDYEKVQLETYMFLSGLNKAIHIEHYNENSNETEYIHNEIFWNNCVNNIIEFIDTNIKEHCVN